MRVALIHIPFVSSLHVPPLAPALLKSCLRTASIDSKVFDFNLLFQKEFDAQHKDMIMTWMMTPDITLTTDAYNAYLSFVRKCVLTVVEYSPTGIGISVFSHNSHRFAEDFCYMYRTVADCYILLGGSGLQTFQSQYQKPWSTLMLESKLADCALHGEGELVISDLFINRTVGTVNYSQIDNEQLHDLPVPDFDDYYLENYGPREHLRLPITSSKGCVRNCSFCDVAAIWPKFRYRRGKNVADEMISIYQHYKIKNFSFTDSLINGGLKPFREMNEVLSAELPDTISYDGHFICRDAKSMPARDFSLMRRGGCNLVSIGIESGSEQVRQHMKKGFTDQDIDYTAQQLIDNGIKQSWNIIVGYPTETESDWQDTLSLLKKYKQYNQWVKIVPVGVFQFLKNIPLRDHTIMESLELMSHTLNGYDEYNWIAGTNPTNTFATRVERWFQLVDLLNEYDMLDPISNVEQRSMVIKQQLDYYASSSIKTTIPIIPYSLQSSTDFGFK